MSDRPEPYKTILATAKPSSEASIAAMIEAAAPQAPRITPEHIDAQITDEAFHVFPGTMLTVCCLTLRNGFTVTGESACASPANFSAEIGRAVSRRNAREKIWSLEGYLLRERLSDRGTEAIARTCHEVNRGLCAAFGDHSQKPWADAEPWQRESAVKGVEYAMAHPHAPASAQHEAWSADKLADGWVYGPVKDAAAKTHPCLVPFEDLPPEQQAKDHTFKAVVRSLSPY